ncbi:MAG: hypothetical protein ACR2OT_03770 [Parvibaculales bacterium]
MINKQNTVFWNSNFTFVLACVGAAILGLSVLVAVIYWQGVALANSRHALAEANGQIVALQRAVDAVERVSRITEQAAERKNEAVNIVNNASDQKPPPACEGVDYAQIANKPLHHSIRAALGSLRGPN